MNHKHFADGWFGETNRERRKRIPWQRIVSFKHVVASVELVRIEYFDKHDKLIGSEEVTVEDLIRSHISYVEREV